MRNKFVYSCSIKIHASGFSELLESIFCILLVLEVFSLQKVVEMLEEVVVRWWVLRWIWQMRQNFVAQIIQFWSIGCMTWGGVLSWRRIGPFLLTNASCRYCHFQCLSLTGWAYFSDVMVLAGFSGEGNGTPLQYFCLENPMDGGAWWAAVHGVARVGHDWATSLWLFTFMHWRRKWQPTPVFLPGESQERGSLVGCRLWGLTESDTTEVT